MVHKSDRLTDAEVHVIDLSSPDRKVAAAILHSCVTTGFFYVSNHGVAQQIIENQWQQNRAFFDLPLKEKLLILADSNGRGYTPFSAESLDPEHQSQGDTKEGLVFGREVPADGEEANLPLHGPNQWPPEGLLPGYKAAMQAYMDAIRGLADRLLPLIAIALQLPTDFFDMHFDKPMIALRPLHYSAQTSLPDEGIYGAGAHTDYGLLTVLATDENPGLQICTEGKWAAVRPVPGTFIINLGDMLERWTNGYFRSTLHRVVNCVGKERYSTAFFYNPNFNARVECLPQCCKIEAAKFPPTTSGQHVLDMYAAANKGHTSTVRVAEGLMEDIKTSMLSSSAE
ncbi:TPA: hypothetical protein ACH3X3_007680 [Trebouxia sp. C0006]